MKRASFFLVFAIALAGCVGQPPVTKLDGSVSSGCIEAESVYHGYRMACIAVPSLSACTPVHKAQSESVRTEFKKLCDAQPADTPANRAKINALVAQQRAVGRIK